MRTKMLNILVVMATVVTLLPLAAFGGVVNAQQIGPVRSGVVGSEQGVPACATLPALQNPATGQSRVSLTPAIANNAAGTAHTVTLGGFISIPGVTTITATWTVEGFPATPQLLATTAGITPTATIKMDTPGSAYITAVVTTNTGIMCFIQAKKHFIEITGITITPTNARRQMIWNEGLKRFDVVPVAIVATVVGEYPVKFGNQENAPERQGAPAPGGGFFHWTGTLLKVINAPVANAVITRVLTTPCTATGPVVTDSLGRVTTLVNSSLKSTCQLTVTAATNNPNLGTVSATAFVTFFDLEAEKTPQVRWAGEEIVLEKWFGTELAGFAVNFYLEQQSPGCLVGMSILAPPIGQAWCDTVFTVIDPSGYARVMFDSEDQGQVDVKAVVLNFQPFDDQIIRSNGLAFVEPEQVPLGLGILNKHAFLVWFLKLEDVTVGNEILPTAAQIEAALGRAAGSLTPNQVAALIGIVIGAPNTLNQPTNVNAGQFSGDLGTTRTDGANAIEPGRLGLADQIRAITGSPGPTELQTANFAQLFNAHFNVDQPSPLVGGVIPGTTPGGSPFVTNRTLLQAQVRGWFVGENMCVNGERVIDDRNRLEILPRGRCILPDDWPVLAGRLDWKQTRPTYDLMDSPGDQVKSGPVDLFSALVPGNANFPFNAFGAFYQYRTAPTSPFVVQGVDALVAAYPVIGPNSSLDPAYLSAGFVFDPRISLAPRDNAVRGPEGLAPGLIPASCDDVNDPFASGLCTRVAPGVGARGSGPLVAPGPGGPGTGPQLIYVDATGVHFWARKTHVPNGFLNWYDAPMPPAKMIFESVGTTVGNFEAADKANIFRVRDLIGFADGGIRVYAWRTTAPFYFVEIPAASDIPPMVNNGGYDWDSWGFVVTRPMGPYPFWTVINRPFPNKATVYSDNNGRAKIFLSSGDQFDLARFRNQQGGFDIPAGAIVGTSTVRVVADYPYFRKHPPAVSNDITKTWVSQFLKRLTAEPVDNKIRVTATITDVHGLCPAAEEIRWFIEGPPGFTGTIVTTSDGTAGLLTQTTAVTRNLTNCKAFVLVENLSANARVKAFFVDELLERFFPETVTGGASSLSSQATFSANVAAGPISLGGVSGGAVVGADATMKSANVSWTTPINGQELLGTLTVLVGTVGSDFSLQISNYTAKLGDQQVSIPIKNGSVWILGGSGTADYSFNGSATLADGSNVSVTVSGTVTVNPAQ